ncbi:MAG: type VI secretion system tip protein VgrG [Gammaproteobacteria bacterium]|nr:type VI secretion system tip protein VgrG [Gammaproteobacteria bacterium]
MGTMESITTNTARMTLTVNGDAVLFRVIHAATSEGVSRPFVSKVIAMCLDDRLDFSTVIGKNATLAYLNANGDVERLVSGLVTTIQQGATEGRFTQYSLSIYPPLQLLASRYDSRIFQEKTVPDIIGDVLKKAGILSDQFSFNLNGKFKARDYCVQYNESDLNFISRLMEEEGIYYYFEHTDSGHVMSIVDDAMAHNKIPKNPEIPFYAGGQIAHKGSGITAFRYAENIHGVNITLRDFNYERPNADLTATKSNGEHPVYDMYVYPGGYSSLEEGTRYATLLHDRIKYQKIACNGGADDMRLAPGFIFKFTGHPRYNGEYLILSVKDEVTQPQVLEEGGSGEFRFSSTFTCIPSDVTFRPPAPGFDLARRPTIESIQTAIVVGPEGEEIYTDNLGRVKVQFHWDRVGTRNEKSSCWVRVSQLWAGEGWGAMFIPRIGQEVIVSFVDGDPDRPLITGRVYHGDNLPPYPLPKNKNKSAIRSDTTPGGGTYNELMMDDTKDKTRVHLTNAYGHKLTQDEELQHFTLETRDNNRIKMDDKEQFIEVTTTNGHKIRLDDKNKQIAVTSTDGYTIVLNDKEEQMQAKTKNGHIMTFDDKNKRVELTSTSGHTLILDDDKKNMGMTSSRGHKVVIDDDKGMINLEDSNGMHRVKIDINGSKIQIGTDSGAIELSASAGNIDLKGMNINIEAQMELKLKGLNITSEAGLNQQVKGTMVTVEAGGPNTIKGTPVMIN